MALQKGQEIETCNYEVYIAQVLEYLEDNNNTFEFNKKNQYHFIYLCDLFQLTEVKRTMVSYLGENCDVQSVFEFLKISSQQPENDDAMRESYWIIVFIYLRKIAWDISESFTNSKTK